QVVARERGQLDDAADEEAGEAGGAAQPRGLAETARRDAADVDAAPFFAAGIAFADVVVGAIAADDGDGVAAVCERDGQIAPVLGGRGDVGIESLIKKEK